MQRMRTLLYIFTICLGLSVVNVTFAQQNSIVTPTIFQGEVIEIVSVKQPLLFGRESEIQTLRVENSDGVIVENVSNEYVPVTVGSRVYFTQSFIPETGVIYYSITQIDRSNGALLILGFFVVVYLLVAGFKGLRSLVALSVAVLSVWFVLLPAIVAGYDALLVSFALSLVILGVAIFITHGFTIVSTASYLGSTIAIVVTLGFASLSVYLTRVSGWVSEESQSITLLYGPTIDLQGLLLATMIIGILGVLDDVAIMQAAMVREFMYSKTHTLKEIFVKAMRVGREHAAALVNTLVLAYTAVALPLFLIVLAPISVEYLKDLPLSYHLSNELFIIEFIRSVVGSFGLVITIPLVTAIALFLFNKYPPTEPGIHHHHHH